jgi:TRAP transporter 4TM/12TM fusion protein
MKPYTWSDFWTRRSWQQKIAALVGITLAIFQILTAIFGTFDSLFQRGIHLGLGLVLVFLVHVWASKSKGKIEPNWFDWLLIAFSIPCIGYLLTHYEWVMVERFRLITPLYWYEKILGVAMIILVCEATRRVFGRALFYVVIASIVYPFAGPYLPGFLHTSPTTWLELVDFNYLSLGGIFGIPLGVSATEIALFIIFGAILMHGGGSQLFSNIAAGLTARMAGGPAKVAVIASCMMGTITGSGAANVATTGSMTIPMMKKAGYKPEFAAAVEALSSTGGQLMPPVMGAAAFVMAAFSGIPYRTIIYYALFPAVLFFVCVFSTVHLEAKRLNLLGIKPEITLGRTLKDYGHMIIPIVVLVYLLIAGYTPRLAGGYGVITALAACQLRSKTRLSIFGMLKALEDGAKGMLIVTISTAAAGIIIGSVDITGVGNRLGTVFIELAGGNLFIGLILGMFIALLLGLGIPTTPAYIVQVATVIPALIALGLPDYVAHLFAFYYACLSLISPPVAAASFTAAAIAKADGWRTGWLAFRIGMVAFVVPIVFAYEQSILLIGPIWKVAFDVFTASLGAFCFAVAGEGYLLRNLRVYERIIALFAALLLIYPSRLYSVFGVGLLAILLIINRLDQRREGAFQDK